MGAEATAATVTSTVAQIPIWRYLVPAWLLYLLPWWLLIPGAGGLFYTMNYAAQQAALEQIQQEQLVRAGLALDQALAQIRYDIELVAHFTETTLADSDIPLPIAKDRLAQLYVDFATTRSDYMQVRWLTLAGMEQVRVDSNAGQTTIIPAAALQDKSDRYYVHAVQKLAKGEIYLSPLDLNIERGVIEMPYRPTLRSAKQVYDRSGNVMGMVVLNLDARRLLNGPHIATAVMVLNGESYWLHSANTADEWGFMFSDTARRLAVREPAAWAYMQTATQSEGLIMTASGLWSFYRVNYAAQSADRATAVYWYVVSCLPTAQLAALRNSLLLRYGVLSGLVLLIVSAFARALSRAHAAINSRAAELAVANKRLGQTLDHLQSSQQQLVQAEKLSSLGLMVAGVAHELNTPIGAAMLSATTLDEQLAELDAAYRQGTLRRSAIEQFLIDQSEGLEMVNTGLARAATLVRQFRQVAADRATADRQRFLLTDLVADVCALLRNEIKHSYQQLQIAVPADIELDSYPGPLGQIVQNLIQNALLHAFPDGSTGTVTVSAQLVAEGSAVELRVMDDGIGIAEEDRPRVFDPFFTTRRGRGGTGLGLHIAHHLTTAVLGGKIHIAAGSAGRGTTVYLCIPTSAPAVSATISAS